MDCTNPSHITDSNISIYTISVISVLCLPLRHDADVQATYNAVIDLGFSLVCSQFEIHWAFLTLQQSAEMVAGC